MLNQLVEKWKTNLMSDDYLTRVLSLYKYKFLGNSHDFVQNVYKNKAYRKTKHNTTYLIVPSDLSDPKVKGHLVFRHPIHISGPQYRNIYRNKMKEIIGYEDQTAFEQGEFNSPFIRYGILGQVYLDNKFGMGRSAFVLHTWGVNLESDTTIDSIYVYLNGEFSINRYEHLLRRMFAIVLKGAHVLHEKTKRKVVLRITGLGLGAWLNYVNKQEKQEIRQKYDQLLFELVKDEEKWLQLRYPQFPLNKTVTVRDNQWVKVENNHDPFGKPDTIEDKDYEPYPENSVLLMVNAWDDRSFIGNGGKLDNSLDGWMVAGGTKGFSKGIGNKPLGYYFKNNSYLHNVFFSPTLLDSTKWERVSM